MNKVNAQLLTKHIDDVVKQLAGFTSSPPDTEMLTRQVFVTSLLCMDDSLLIVDPEGILLFANLAANTLLNLKEGNIGIPLLNNLITKNSADESLLTQFARLVTNGENFNIQTCPSSISGEIQHASGQTMHVQIRTEAIVLHDQPIGAVLIMSEQQFDESLLKRKIAQLETIAQFGQLALGPISRDNLFREAVEMVAGTLKIPFCKALEQQDSGLTFRALAGWPRELLGQTFKAEDEPHAGYSLHMSEPILVYDLEKENRFLPSNFTISLKLKVA